MGACGIKLDKEESLSRKAERGAQRLGIGTGSPIILMGLHIVEALKLPTNTDVEVPPVIRVRSGEGSDERSKVAAHRWLLRHKSLQIPVQARSGRGRSHLRVHTKPISALIKGSLGPNTREGCIEYQGA